MPPKWRVEIVTPGLTLQPTRCETSVLHMKMQNIQYKHTRPPLRRFPFLGGVCNPGVGVLASLSLLPASEASAWPFAAWGAPTAVACEGVSVGGSGICTGAAAEPAGFEAGFGNW